MYLCAQLCGVGYKKSETMKTECNSVPAFKTVVVKKRFEDLEDSVRHLLKKSSIKMYDSAVYKAIVLSYS